MEFADWKRAGFELEVAVHEVHGFEEGTVGALVGGEHLHHPVHHTGAQAGVDLVSL